MECPLPSPAWEESYENMDVPLLPSSIFGILAAANVVGVMLAKGGVLVFLLVTLGLLSAPFFPLAILLLMDAAGVDSRHLGAAGGMFFCVAEIGGFTGPLFMGALVDLTGTFFPGAVFLGCLCLAISGLARCLGRNGAAKILEPLDRPDWNG
ncbi:MAG: hypothetical protein DRH20_06210 [Deltaproteobacteria bacterium]|nr:MAG: hypothetical protein DRH20_06210 [Deltaproteobacteria bacterium]